MPVVARAGRLVEGTPAETPKEPMVVRLPFPEDLVLTPVSRWPTTLAEETVAVVIEAPLERRVRRVVEGPDSRPRTSIVIVTVDGLVFTRLCLESLLAGSAASDFEVIVVDNGSTDGTRDYLGRLAEMDGRVRVTFNDRNLGFGAATNQGVRMARGDALVLLNNDTIVPAGAIDTLVERLSDSRYGLVGVVTNRAGNEAEIEVPYRTYGELARFAREQAGAHAGQVFDIRTATMFCAALRREVWSTIGPIDERFEVGLFEDDDYAMRVRQAGYRVACAEDVFVHHFGQASIGKLGPTGEYGPLYHANRERWEAKWGVAWLPYERREKKGYRELVERVRRAVCDIVPLEATVAVISKGDAEFLKLEGRRAWHFPQGADGAYAGHNPADSAACIAEIQRLHAQGAEYLVIPATARWWLTHYEELGRYLRSRDRLIVTSDDCDLFRLGTDASALSPGAGT